MIIKEKNIITFIDDNNEKVGTYDINSGIFYGKNGRALKKWTNKISQVFSNDRDDCAIVKVSYYWADNSSEAYRNICNYGIYLDKLFNIGIPESALDYYYTDNFPTDKVFQEMIKNKDYIQKVKEKQFNFSITDYKKYVSNIIIKTILSNYNCQFTETQIKALITIYEKFENKKYIDFCIKVFMNPKYHLDISIDMNNDNIEPTVYEFIRLFQYYYRACCALGRDYNSKDFLNDFHRVTQLYKIHINKSHDEIFTKHVNPDVLKFEDENFIVICPKNRDDLAIEGKLMHNCVGTYGPKVVRGDCAIVFIRNKIMPDEPYVTCEIGRNGIIRQYLAKYNKIPSDLAINFRKKYQSFLHDRKTEISKMLLC